VREIWPRSAKRQLAETPRRWHRLQIAHPALNTSTLRLMASHASARLIITNAPGTIGGFVSHGCIRMYDEDIMDLYSRVGVGTRVVVTR